MSFRALKLSKRATESTSRDQWFGLVIETETETQTSKVSRPRLIETKEFPSCRDRDLSRLDNLVVVETETHRDWMKVVETETFQGSLYD